MLVLDATRKDDEPPLYDLTNSKANRMFNLHAQSGFGGIMKKIIHHGPDILHSYAGLAGLSLMGMDGLMPLEPGLGFPSPIKNYGWKAMRSY